MPAMIRSEIKIPDHEVLRKIGGGAYGEVWMARGVTGALRAVKVVWREDFEDERGFEREFEGILKFEPISRDNPGLVNILHVGRGDDIENPFYYYVMELGDDVNTGNDVNPVEYEARTLLSDLKASAGKPLDVGFCVEVGRRLADSLNYLHEKDLAHRDVKPANVIFVEGKAKLADIGLVAARGQQTFVGTEGFVPPEGPGSGQADIYSLGKVLYEMATGKDRLQFPELPDGLPEVSNRKQWLALNELICNICDPKLSKRTINTARRLSDSLSKIELGKKVQMESKLARLRLLLLFLVVCGAVFGLYHFKPWSGDNTVDLSDQVIVEPAYKYEECSVQFLSTPHYAEITGHGQEGDLLTNTEFFKYKPGTILNLVFKLDGYRLKKVKFVVPDKELEVVNVILDTFLPPKKNEYWSDSLGARYAPKIGFHESGYVRKVHYDQFLSMKGDDVKVDQHIIEKFNEQGKRGRRVLMTARTAKVFASWLENDAKLQGLLEEDQCIVYRQDVSKKKPGGKKPFLYPTICIAKQIPYAGLELTSNPEGARVYIDGVYVGVTPMKKQKLRPEDMLLEFSLDGYKTKMERVDLSDNEVRQLSVSLVQNNGVVFDQLWINSLKVKMVPFDDGKLVSVWEVRVKDYKDFTKQTRHRASVSPGFPQKEDHPVVGVSRSDALAFCKWLTEKERKEDRISARHEYRLPTDVEWSLFCGIRDEEGRSPVERYRESGTLDNSGLRDLYPWGRDFPPRDKVANLADKAAAKAEGVPANKTISGYSDAFTNTSPVGSFAPNELGMFDVSGNVFEWVMDPYMESNKDLGVVRGGSWATFQSKELFSRSRFTINMGVRDNQYGFRVVLVNKQDEVAEDGEGEGEDGKQDATEEAGGFEE